MTHTYNISGITCGNCVAKVKSELLKMGDVVEANVQVSAPQAKITMQKHIPLPILQQAISRAGNFIITASDQQEHPQVASCEVITLKAYWPLVLVFAFITGIATLTSINAQTFTWMTWMNSFMGGFFIAFSFFKFLDLKAFAESYATYDVLAKEWLGYGFLYPFIELALGIAYITGFDPLITNAATIVVMGFSSVGVIQSVVNKKAIRCACLGTVFKLPMSTVTIVEDLLMVAMAVIAIAYVL